MKGSARALVVVLALIIPFAANADDVTISGTVTFTSIDGSSLDHDGAANGVFTVDDGDLTILGIVQCNDDVSPNACSMAFAADGSVTLGPGSALYAENRSGSGSGGDISLTAGADIVVAASSSTQPGAVISSGNEHSASGDGGHITIDAGGAAFFGSGSIVSAAAKGGQAGSITVTADGAINAAGLIASGPSSVLAPTRYTGEVLTGGSSSHAGGAITLLSHSHAEPALTIASTATIASQGGSGNAGTVALEGCGIEIEGLVASVTSSGSSAAVVVRSGTYVDIDGRDLDGSGPRAATLRADSLQDSASGHSVGVFARETVSVSGPVSGTNFVLNSNGGSSSNNASGTITVISTAGSVIASGNAASAANFDAGDQGGTIRIAAAFDATLDTANLIAAGNRTTNNSNRAGGTIDIRAHSGAVSWQNGSGDVRPTGSASGVAAANQGTITLTFCTSVSTSGSAFPTNGAAVGTFPVAIQACSPAVPALPPGETHPDCNDPAVAVDDAWSVAEGGTLSVGAPGVLANDSDPDGDPLTAVLVSGPANASSFTLNANGSFNYVHDGGETTTDSFTYVANDGATNSNTATVHLTIIPVNDVPVANDDSYSVDEAGTINFAAPGVLANDTDADGSALSAVLQSGPANASSFTLNADGSFLYVHDGSETTSDSFTYTASDGTADSNVATVSITISPINDAPVANDDSVSVVEGGTVNQSAPGVLGNDTDAEGSALTAVLVSGPASASSFTLNADGSFSYVHDGGESASDIFTYKANDGTADSNVATVSIAIDSVNDAPVADADAYSVDEGDSLAVGAPGVLANDSDAENDALSAVLVSGPANASSFTLAPDGSFTYVHNGGETTSDTFTYKANDGTADSNTVTVTITVNPVNDAPVAVADSHSVGFGGTLNVSAPGVLGNDSDAEGSSLTAVLVSGPSSGTLTLNADGSFSYTHTGSTPGTDSFTYKANDGTTDSNIVSVTIDIVNEAPVAADEAFLGVGNTELRVGTGGALHPAAVVSGSVLSNDTDSDNAPSLLVVSAFDATSVNGGSVSMNPNGTFNYLPPTGFVGTDAFNYTITDGQATDSGTVTIVMTDRVWYVNPASAGAQSGRSTEPFASVGQAQGFSSINDYIHVAQGAQVTGITLKNGQRLVGSGVALVVPPYTLAGATVRPTLGGAVGLADANLVVGLNVAGLGNGILGISVNGGAINEVGITASGDGISLTTSTGAISITDVTVTPGGRGLFITGGSATVTASNLDITTVGSPAILADAGTLNIGPGADGSTVTTTNGIGIDLSGLALGVVLHSVNVDAGGAAANGIRLVGTTGSFSVTGAGAAGTGGTIQNSTARGADLQHAGSVSLAFMNFTNASSVNGDAASVCGNTFAGTNTGCNAAIHAVGTAALSLSGVNVTGGAQIGINGNGVSNLVMNDVSVTGVGNETFEHGVQFVNLSGTSSVTNSTFSNNFYRQFTVQNSSGTLSLAVNGSTFNGTGVATASGAQGVLISGNGTANITTSVQSSQFTNNFSTGYFTDGADSAVLDITVSGNTFTANGGGGITLGVTNAAALAYDVVSNAISGGISAPIAVLKASGSFGDVSGIIANNTLGLAGVPASACSAGSCDGILLNANGSGSFTVAADGNTIRNFTSRGIALNASQTVVANVAIRNNIVSEPGPSASSGVFAQSGVLSADTSSLCADIQGNSISGAYAGGQIRVRNRFAGTTFRLPGYAGAGNDTTAVAAFLSGQNGGATATATINANTFGGGAACVAP